MLLSVRSQVVLEGRSDMQKRVVIRQWRGISQCNFNKTATFHAHEHGPGR